MKYAVVPAHVGSDSELDIYKVTSKVGRSGSDLTPSQPEAAIFAVSESQWHVRLGHNSVSLFKLFRATGNLRQVS